jgi:hypothetical protein
VRFESIHPLYVLSLAVLNDVAEGEAVIGRLRLRAVTKVQSAEPVVALIGDEPVRTLEAGGLDSLT